MQIQIGLHYATPIVTPSSEDTSISPSSSDMLLLQVIINNTAENR